MSDILVSIICITYNHEKFIKYAIDGFLMQKTNFKYEILIHDDASTDATQQILKEYQKKFPELIKVIYQKENQFNKGKSGTVLLLENAKGKYLAFCEGDDYWVDINKLQKQVDFLKNHANYSAVYHNVKIIDEKNNEFNDKNARNVFPIYKNYTIMKRTLLIGTLTGQLGTLVCINFWKIFDENLKSAYCNCRANGDVKINILLNNIGNIKFFADIMSCYRRTYNGASYNARTKNMDLTFKCYSDIVNIEKMILIIFGDNLSKSIFKRSKAKYLTSCLVNSIRRKNLKRFYSFVKLYIKSDTKVYFLYYFFKRGIVYFLMKLKILERLPQGECNINE